MTKISWLKNLIRLPRAFSLGDFKYLSDQSDSANAILKQVLWIASRFEIKIVLALKRVQLEKYELEKKHFG